MSPANASGFRPAKGSGLESTAMAKPSVRRRGLCLSRTPLRGLPHAVATRSRLQATALSLDNRRAREDNLDNAIMLFRDDVRHRGTVIAFMGSAKDAIVVSDTPRLVDAATTPMVLKTVQSRRIDPKQLTPIASNLTKSWMPTTPSLQRQKLTHSRF